ncbi:hypothetical protein KEM56_000274, partial [Ascosphaera pollenicola]
TFRAIAGHDYYRTKVKEIIYDDAPLESYRFGGLNPFRNVVSREFQLERDENLRHLYNRVARNGLCENEYTIFQLLSARTQMDCMDTWKYYHTLIADQELCRNSDQDYDALVYGFQQFVNLKRITLTPAAHGFIFRPLYRTPMIRAFPFGFNYPIPVGWVCSEGFHGAQGLAWPWNHDIQTYRLNRQQYRGFCVTLAALRTYLESPHRKNHPIEFCANASLLDSGLNPRMFDAPCIESTNLTVLLSQPGFRRLELTFTANLISLDDYKCYRSGVFRQALSLCRHLEYFSFTNTNFENPPAPLTLEDAVPLVDMFPVSSWPQLKHFGIAGWRVFGPHLIEFLRMLPESLESVELSRLTFVELSGDHASLLEAMRDQLDWKHRPPDRRPHARMIARKEPGVGIIVDKEVDRFLYENGPNPLGEKCTEGQCQDTVKKGFGIIKDFLDPLYERPYL